ncbi:MAG: hypothetical protein LBI87_08790, partial [Candidatus Accumulibacter sp.]|nr:hypothetical protein [Accumulibacter sp.]
GAPVVEINGAAVDAVKQVLARLNAHGLHFAFLDPFDLAALNFDIIVALSTLKRIDMLVHISQMDLPPCARASMCRRCSTTGSLWCNSSRSPC